MFIDPFWFLFLPSALYIEEHQIFTCHILVNGMNSKGLTHIYLHTICWRCLKVSNEKKKSEMESLNDSFNAMHIYYMCYKRVLMWIHKYVCHIRDKGTLPFFFDENFLSVSIKVGLPDMIYMWETVRKIYLYVVECCA